MATLAGKVATITGMVQVKNPITGVVTTLKLGDKVFADDVIMTSPDGNITINLTNGDLLALGRDMKMTLNEDVTGTAAMTDSATEGAIDVKALQLAVLQGNFEDLEATAAGGEATPNSSANAGPLNIVDRLGLEGDVTSGFETATTPAVLAETQNPTSVEPDAIIEPPLQPPTEPPTQPPIEPPTQPPIEPLCDKEIVGTDSADFFGVLYPTSESEIEIIDLTLILGGTTCITHYAFDDDFLILSDLIEGTVTGNDLGQYLNFEETSVQGEDKTIITIDSNGSDTGGDISTIYVDIHTQALNGINDSWQIVIDGQLTDYYSD